MLSTTNDLTRLAAAVLGVEVVFLPGLTGAPLASLPLELTDKVQQDRITPGCLSMNASAELFADFLTARAAFSPLRPVVQQALIASASARNALGERAFLPRHVVRLGREALHFFLAAADGDALVCGIDWVSTMGPVVM